MTSCLACAEFNDAFRQRCGVPTSRGTVPGQIVWTSGIDTLSSEAKEDIWKRVREFDDFTEDDDPYGEHDFGAFDHAEAGKVFWKIAYYDPTYTMGSKNPCDLTRTARVLTVMLASEY